MIMLIEVVEEQQKIIEQQNKMIATLIEVLASWEAAGYEAAELKKQAQAVQEKGKEILEK